MHDEQRTLFGRGIAKSRRIVHFDAVEDRRKTLQTLIVLAEGSSASDCWDDQRAESLLRSQSSAAEARELGMSEAMIQRVFGSGSMPFAQLVTYPSAQCRPANRTPTTWSKSLSSGTTEVTGPNGSGGHSMLASCRR